MATVPAPQTWANSGVTPTTAADLNREIRDTQNFLLTPPAFYGYRSTALSLTNNTGTLITLLAEVLDRPSNENHSTSTNPSRFLPQTPGYWRVDVTVTFAGIASPGAGVICYAKLLKNAAGAYGGGQQIAAVTAAPAPNSNATVVSLASVLIPLSVGDYLEMFALQTSGGSLALDVSQFGTFMQAQWMTAL